MPRAKWDPNGAVLVTVEKLLRKREGQPVEVYVNGTPKTVWGFVVLADDETLLLETGGGKQYTIRMSDISFVVVDPSK